MENILFDIGVIIIIATAVGFIARLLKQPLIPSYILAGVLIGPIGFQLISDAKTITTLSEIGIAFLLFIVGLRLDIRKLKDIGWSVSLSGIIQISLMFFIGLLASNILGMFSMIESIYIAMMVSFSSTLVVIKLLSDKQELDTLHGRIIIGTLLIEDLFAILAMTTLTTIDNISGTIIAEAIGKGLLIVIVAILLGKYVFRPVFNSAAKSMEILFLMSLSVCFMFALAAHELGLSIVVGAFMAGVSLSNLPYNYEIVSRVKPLRDFFATIFFVTLGMELVISSIQEFIPLLIILTIGIVVIKPLIIMLLQSLFGYTKRTAFLTGINLAQISEFALIIISQGLEMGHVSEGLFSVTIIIATISMTTTSYFIKYDNSLYRLLEKWLNFLDTISAFKKEDMAKHENKEYEVFLIGYNRIAYSIAKKIMHLKKNFLVIDYNPDLVKLLAKENIPCMYGDISNIEILEKLNFKKAELVISTVPDFTDNLMVIEQVKKKSHKAIIFVTAMMIEEALKLYDRGADYVILPHILGGDHVSILLEDLTRDIGNLLRMKIKHIEDLKERQKRGHDHHRYDSLKNS